MKQSKIGAWIAFVIGALYFIVPLIGTFEFSLRMKRGEYSFEAYRAVLTDPNFPLNSPTDPLHYIFGTRRLAADWTVATGTPMRFAAGCGVTMANGQPAPFALFNGRIDGVRIAGKALSSVDLIHLAIATKLDEVAQDDVRGFWDFSQGIGTLTVHDAKAGWNGRGVNWPRSAATPRSSATPTAGHPARSWPISRTSAATSATAPRSASSSR